MLLDNGRTRALADQVGRQALRCIRCSACLNSCPVYERVGGHAYGSVYPGPIGAILNPLLKGVGTDPQVDSLPYASSLCGACFEVCPVRIDIPSVLVDLRAQVVDAHRGGRPLGADRRDEGRRRDVRLRTTARPGRAVRPPRHRRRRTVRGLRLDGRPRPARGRRASPSAPGGAVPTEAGRDRRARDEILGKVRSALAGTAPAARPPIPHGVGARRRGRPVRRTGRRLPRGRRTLHRAPAARPR